MATLDDPGPGVQRATASCKMAGCDWSYTFQRQRGGGIGPLVRVIISGHLMMCHGVMAKEAERIARETR